MSKPARIALGVSIAAVAYGACFLVDARPARHTSWPRYLALAFVVGLLLLAMEVTSELIARRDRTTDPTSRRLLRVSALLVLGVTALVAVWLVARQL